ncbi:MAG: hypothetical protein H7A49_12620 [Akkermansiaceae bacterium]|nr:hypothetical protein [Akkermansiaceae bacterium]MCP5544739.1 hypothetical protein [Akkermansiaceae bacterium]MCP5545879.1 hypothetical protein [Akkermansiaceae bacterium]
MKTTVRHFVLVLALAVPAAASSYQQSVVRDTYIRNDGTGGVQNGDADNEVMVGSNGATSNLRPLLGFDVSSIVSDVNTIGGGNYANLVISSATLTVYERRGRANTVNVIVNGYGYNFNPAVSVWADPDGDGSNLTGDTAAGGTPGTLLGSQSVTWDATADNQSAVVNLTSDDLEALIAANIAGNVNFLLTTTTPTQNFLSITSDQSPTTARHSVLAIEYTVNPAGGPTFELDPASPDPDFAFPLADADDSPLTRTVRYKHTGASGNITVSAVTLNNDAGGVFTIDSVVPAAGSTLAPGETMDITIAATSSAGGDFTGELFVDTDASGQDKTVPLTASFYKSGELRNTGSSMITSLAAWGGGSTWVSPGLVVPEGDGMARVRGAGDPAGTSSSLSQAAGVPDGLPEWTLDFRFAPADSSEFVTYTGNEADGGFTDRTFQVVVQGSDVVPATIDFNDTVAAETLINLAYMPDGITSGGLAGFYLFDGVSDTWQLVDFNGDGSALVLDGSIDLDNDGALDAAAGDTVNVHRLTIRGRGFGSTGASYDLTLDGPGAGFPKTVTGLTVAHSLAVDASTPAAYAFIASDTTADSNLEAGFCTPFWVDEVGYFAGDRPAQRLLLFNPPAVLRSLNGSVPAQTITALNDGTSTGVEVSGSMTGAPSVTLGTTLPVTVPAGQTASVIVTFDPDTLGAPDTVALAQLDLSSDDPALAAVAYPLTATKVSDANLVPNGDFETDSSGGVFPLGWGVTGTPTEIASFIPGEGSAVSLAPGQELSQDIFPTGFDGLSNFQADFAFRFSQEDQVHRLRVEGANGLDRLTLRLIANTAADDSIDAFNAGVWATAVGGLSLDVDTTYFVRVIGHDWGAAGAGYTVGFSTDGMNYNTSLDMSAFHATANVPMETVTFGCGATAGSSLSVENVSVIAFAAPTDDFAAWMGGYTFESGADLTPGGDADGDGIANVIEHVLGTAPNAPTTGLFGITGSAGSVSFSHPLNPNLATDVGYSYEWSSDMAEWKGSGETNAGGTTVDIVAGAPVADIVTVDADAVSGPAVRLFVRLVGIQTTP